MLNLSWYLNVSVAGADSNDKGDTTEFEVLSAEACGGDSGTFIGEGDIAEIETLSAEACGVGDIAEYSAHAVLLTLVWSVGE